MPKAQDRGELEEGKTLLSLEGPENFLIFSTFMYVFNAFFDEFGTRFQSFFI